MDRCFDFCPLTGLSSYSYQVPNVLMMPWSHIACFTTNLSKSKPGDPSIRHRFNFHGVLMGDEQLINISRRIQRVTYVRIVRRKPHTRLPRKKLWTRPLLIGNALTQAPYSRGVNHRSHKTSFNKVLQLNQMGECPCEIWLMHLHLTTDKIAGDLRRS